MFSGERRERRLDPSISMGGKFSVDKRDNLYGDACLDPFDGRARVWRPLDVVDEEGIFDKDGKPLEIGTLVVSNLSLQNKRFKVRTAVETSPLKKK